MTDLRLSVHRSTQGHGGNCVELSYGDDRIVLDPGPSLDETARSANAIPPTLDLSRPLLGVIVSHSRQDYLRLSQELPVDCCIVVSPAVGHLLQQHEQLAEPVFRRPYLSGGLVRRLSLVRLRLSLCVPPSRGSILRYL